MVDRQHRRDPERQALQRQPAAERSVPMQPLLQAVPATGLSLGSRSLAESSRLVSQRKSIDRLFGAAIVQCYQPAVREIGLHFQVHDGSKWVVAQLKSITAQAYVFQGSAGQIVIDTANHASIRPSFGGMRPASQSRPLVVSNDAMDDASSSDEEASDHSSDEEMEEVEEKSNAYGVLKDQYRNWHAGQKPTTFQTPFGPVNARHNRKAPYITTNKKQYPKTAVKVDYKDLIEKLKKQGLDDKELASILLLGKAESLTEANAIRAASILMTIVHLAEEWRKQGALKIFRAILRAIAEGKLSLAKIPSIYDFVSSASNGREQVSRIHKMFRGVLPYDLLGAEEQEFLPYMSPLREGDLDSDDEVRKEKDDDFKDGRAWGEHGKEERKHRLNEKDIYKINGRYYNVAHPKIRQLGECLWDTLIHLGVPVATLQTAATNAALTFNQYVDQGQLGALVTALNDLGAGVSIHLTVFTYGREPLLVDQVHGHGGNALHIGLVVDEDGNGHYVPALNQK